MMSLLQRLRRRASGDIIHAQPRACVEAVDIVQEFETERGPRRVLDGISFSVGRGERMAILGRNGAGKSTLIRILAGIDEPSAGEVHAGLSMSWPLALSSSFEGDLTGYDNVRFIARLYGADIAQTLDSVASFAEIGREIYAPVRHYSSGMCTRLAFALSLAIDFDCLLVDEAIAVGDARFQRKCQQEIFERRQDRAMIMAVHGAELVRQYCSSALVLDRGRGRVFQDVGLALRIYETL